MKKVFLMRIKEIIRKNTWFFIPYLVILLLVAIPLVVYPKTSLHLFINSCHSSFWDFFFKYITNLGDGFFGVTVGVLFLLISFRKSFFILATYAGSGIFVQSSPNNHGAGGGDFFRNLQASKVF